MARLEDCPTCGNPSSENASQCPSCGEPLSPGWAEAIWEQREKEEAEEARRAQHQAALARRKAWISRSILFATILVCGVFVIQRFGSNGEVEDSASEKNLYVQKPLVNIRTGPGMNHGVLKQLKKGSALVELSRQGSWVNVGIGPKDGWVHSSLVGATSVPEPTSRAPLGGEPAIKTPPYKVYSRYPDTMCKYNVRLEKPLEKTEIEEIARDIASRYGSACKMIWILHYLPGMEFDDLAWAASHFMPTLEVQIFGLSKKEMEGPGPDLDAEEVIGQWIMHAGGGAWFTLSRRDGRAYGRWTFSDGSSSESPVRESKTQDGRMRFDAPDDSADTLARIAWLSESYVIEKDGRLGLYEDGRRFRLLPEARR